MPRTPMMCMGALAVGLGGYFAYTKGDDFGPDACRDMETWAPSSAEIARTLGAAPQKRTPAQDAARRERFAELFESRYRSHKTPLAVGVDFPAPGVVRLKCPARMETWNMNRIALSAWREAGANLGGTYGVDIYETYIGTRPVRVGELRALPDNPKLARIRYFYSAPPRSAPRER